MKIITSTTAPRTVAGITRNAVLAMCLGLLALGTGFSGARAAVIPPYLVWPTQPGARISTYFGANWISAGCDGLLKRHTGIDIAVPKGTGVFAAEFGTVMMVWNDPGWGWWVTVKHTDWQSRPYTTLYFHINPTVAVGQKVLRGQQIGTVADMGRNSHLHFGIRNAAYSNTANRGALPSSRSCGIYDPRFPEYFVNPLNYTKP